MIDSAGALKTSGFYVGARYRSEIRDNLALTSSVEVGGGSTADYGAAAVSVEYRF